MQVNSQKTIYMPMKNIREERIRQIKVNGNEFEGVDSFGYLGSPLLTSTNQMAMETQGKLAMGNRCHYYVRCV